MALSAARRFAEKEGLRGIGARKIAREIGYTIGTIYNVFEDLDDLVLQLNARTQDELFEATRHIEMGDDPAANLKALAVAHVAYVEAHPRLWSVVFEAPTPEGGLPDWYVASVTRLTARVQEAIAGLVPDDMARERRHHARVLWSSFHGILMLKVSGNLARSESVEEMANDLIENYVAGLSIREHRRVQ